MAWKFHTAAGAEKTAPGSTVVSEFYTASNFGPTAITTTGDGDSLFNMPAFVADGATRYIFDLSHYTQDSGGNAKVSFRLHASLGGALLAEWFHITPSVNPGPDGFHRHTWVPGAGTHTLNVRWKDITTGRTYTMVNNQSAVYASVRRAG